MKNVKQQTGKLNGHTRSRHQHWYLEKTAVVVCTARDCAKPRWICAHLQVTPLMVIIKAITWATLYRERSSKKNEHAEHIQQTLLWAGSASQQIFRICKAGLQNCKNDYHDLGGLIPQNREGNYRTSVLFLGKDNEQYDETSLTVTPELYT